jgi:hypothetical protein
MRLTVLALTLLSAAAGCRTSVRSQLAADMAPARPTMAWAAGAGTPGAVARAGFALAAMSDGQTLMAFGGAANNGQPWSYALTSDTWTQLSSTAAPAARAGSCAAYLPDKNQVLIVGGHDDHGDATPASLLYTVSGATFTNMQGGPAPESGCTASYLPRLGRAIIFDTLGQTWSFDGAQFAAITTLHSPSIRSGAQLVSDPGTSRETSRLLLFGGSTDTSESAELWAFDGTDWAQLGTSSDPAADTTDEPRPLSRTRAAMTIDPTRRLLYVFGGLRMGVYLNDLWRLDLRTATWEKLASGPTGRADAAAAYDVTRDRLLLFGGTGGHGALADGWTLTASAAH